MRTIVDKGLVDLLVPFTEAIHDKLDRMSALLQRLMVTSANLAADQHECR